MREGMTQPSPSSLLLSIALLLLLFLPFTQPKADFTSLYHTADSLFSLISAIATRNPALITPSHCPSAPSIPLYTLTHSSPHTQLSTPKLSFLLNFGEHGRELITSEVALTYLRFLDPQSRAAELKQKAEMGPPLEADDWGGDEFEYVRYREDENDLSDEYLRWLMRNSAVTVIPLLNAWGHRQVEAGQECSRKNEAGVDLNRNWDFMWDHNTKAAHDETYQGVAAFSEAESQCVRDVGLAVRPMVYVNVHSGIRELYFGWDHRGDVMLPNMREVSRLYEHINQYHCSCKVGSAGKIAGYVVFGGSMDWMYTQVNSSYSLTYEVYGKDDAMRRGDCYAAFNPTTKGELQETAYTFATSFFSMQGALIEEKLGIPFPYRLPFFLRSPLFMEEGKKQRNAVRVYYHPWRHIVTRFTASTADLTPSSHPLPVYDPRKLLTKPSPTSADTPLRVLVLADTAFNHHFSTELLLHLTHQLDEQMYARKVHILMVPSLFPSSRPNDEWCWAGLSQQEQQARLDEKYQGEEEVERISRHLRPHVVLELHQSNSTEVEEKRRKNDVFDLFFHNTSTSPFHTAVLTALKAHHPQPFTPTVSITSHLHLRLVYRGWSAAPYPNPSEMRRRAVDRVPPQVYLTQVEAPHTVVRCDWPTLNPEVSGLRENVQRAMRGLHGVLEELVGVSLKGVGLAVVREEEEEGETRSVLVNGDVMVVEEGDGAEWVPSVWAKGGVGRRAWIFLGVVVGVCILLVVVGWRWFKKTTKDLESGRGGLTPSQCCRHLSAYHSIETTQMQPL